MVLKKIKYKLGAPLRLIITSNDTIPMDTRRFFQAIGVQIIGYYGTTETHGPIALSPENKSKIDSNGKILRGIDIRNGNDGEILVRSETIMRGYLNQPESTWDVLDDKGWLYTGDIGYLDKDNYLYITDHKK